MISVFIGKYGTEFTLKMVCGRWSKFPVISTGKNWVFFFYYVIKGKIFERNSYRATMEWFFESSFVKLGAITFENEWKSKRSFILPEVRIIRLGRRMAYFSVSSPLTHFEVPWLCDRIKRFFVGSKCTTYFWNIFVNFLYYLEGFVSFLPYF